MYVCCIQSTEQRYHRCRPSANSWCTYQRRTATLRSVHRGRKEGSVRKFNLDPALCSLVQNRTCQDPGGSKRAFDTPRRGVGTVDLRNCTIAFFDGFDGQKRALRLPNMAGFSWKPSLTTIEPIFFVGGVWGKKWTCGFDEIERSRSSSVPQASFMSSAVAAQLMRVFDEHRHVQHQGPRFSTPLRFDV